MFSYKKLCRDMWTNFRTTKKKVSAAMIDFCPDKKPKYFCHLRANQRGQKFDRIFKVDIACQSNQFSLRPFVYKKAT